VRPLLLLLLVLVLVLVVVYPCQHVCSNAFVLVQAECVEQYQCV
jgi:hypothetical protein